MIIKLYRQMTEIGIHAEKKCRKILRPDSDYSPTVQMWYDRIHAYLQLIRLREGKAKNVGNIICFAERTSIQTPDKLMLEKIAGVCLVEKLRAIQLYEADLNCFNYFIFGRSAIDSLTKNDCLPEELFSQKGSTAEDAKFDKTLMADLSRQARHPMTVVSADVAYCYDRVNHIIMSLVWLVLTGNMPAIVATLICLQTMKFFQRTGFGDSNTFFGGLRHEPYMMGLGQGNRAALPSWIQLSAVLVNVY